MPCLSAQFRILPDMPQLDFKKKKRSFRQFVRLISIVSLIPYFGSSMPLTQEQAPDSTDAKIILYVYHGRAIKDSKWGKIAAFQKVLGDQLRSCGKHEIANSIKSDGVFGQKTKDAIITLTSCPGFESFAVSSSNPLHGAITIELWRKLLPGTPLPSVQERAFALSLSYEDTDYDRAEWNFIEKDGKILPQPNDPKSCLTWVPYGATFGHGGEVSEILKQVHSKNPSLLEKSFGSELPTLLQVMNSHPKNCADLLMNDVFANRQKRDFWKEKFRGLGAIPEVREIYEEYAWKSNKWLKPNLKTLYAGFFANNSDHTKATEIDFAFFTDLSMHMSITTERVTKAATALTEKENRLGRPLSPAERRQVIGKNMVPTGQQKDRMGRNVAFYVDGIGESNLSNEERMAWEARGKRKASNCGLSDSRTFFPSFLKS